MFQTLIRRVFVVDLEGFKGRRAPQVDDNTWRLAAMDFSSFFSKKNEFYVFFFGICVARVMRWKVSVLLGSSTWFGVSPNVIFSIKG